MLFLRACRLSPRGFIATSKLHIKSTDIGGRASFTRSHGLIFCLHRANAKWGCLILIGQEAIHVLDVVTGALTVALVSGG